MRDVITLALIVAGVLFWAGAWSKFMYETWRAPKGTPPDLNSNLVGVVNVFGGILGTAFAVALGINQAQNQDNVHGANDAANVLTTEDWSRYSVAGAIAVFFIVGVAAFVTWLFRMDRAPEAVKNFALVFVGYAASVLAVALNVPTNVANNGDDSESRPAQTSTLLEGVPASSVRLVFHHSPYPS